MFLRRLAPLLCLVCLSVSFSCADTEDEDPEPKPLPGVQEAMDRFPPSTLPFEPHPDLVRPLNLYTDHLQLFEWRCGPEDDHDEDGLIGCDDPDCWDIPPPHSCSKTQTFLDLTEYGDTKCRDGLDNDNDGLIDCEDRNSCNCGAAIRDPKGSLMAVAATPKLIVLAFPPADRTGFDLAIGGQDQPWKRVELTDIPIEKIGAISAVGSLESKVWIALRELAPPEAVHVFSWSEEQGVENLNFQRPEPSNPPAGYANCPDLEIIEGYGNLDMFYRQGGEGHGTVIHSRFKNGQWTSQTAATLRPDLYANYTVTLGCQTRAAYDSYGKLQFLTTVSGNPKDVVPEEGQFPPRHFLQTEGFFEIGDGTFLANRPRDLVGFGHERLMDPNDPQEFGPVAAPMHVGFDIQRIGDQLVSGPLVTATPDAEQLNERVGFGVAYAATSLRYGKEFPMPDQFKEMSGFDTLQRNTWGVKIGLGGAYAMPVRDEFSNPNFGGQAVGYAYYPLAPAFMTIERGLRHPSYARGERRYDVGMCLNQDGEIVVCAGGIVPSVFDSHTVGVAVVPTPPPKPPTILSSTVSNGDVVPLDLPEIRVQLDLRGAADSEVFAILSPQDGQRPVVTPNVTVPTNLSVVGGEATVELVQLEPSTPYILSFWTKDLRTFHSRLFAEDPSNPPEIRFRTALGGLPDPRDGERNYCEPDGLKGLYRDDDGYCHHEVPLTWNTTEINLALLTFDVSSAGDSQPWLINAHGRRVDGELEQKRNVPGWTALHLERQLAAPGGSCCGLLCNEDGFCGPGGCEPQGEPCTTDPECCSETCEMGTCVRCRPEGSMCAAAEECCSGNCDNGTCGAVQCKALGALCMNGAECCSGSCPASSVCEVGAEACVTLGTACVDDDTCCRGSCREIGNGTSVCDESRCFADGQECILGGGTWELHYPEGIKNGVGALVHPKDLVFRFESAQSPVQLVSTYPEDQATNVPTDVKVLIYFDGITLVQAGGILLEDVTNQMSITTSPFQETPNVWGLLHLPLTPATQYRVTINQVATGDGRIADWTPHSFTFETAP